ncbi:Acyl-CoA thioester hydrolase YbgC [Anaerohalosphaera lusitana]|uniref:Acyl-CoA thioester hydrolase YbgC n=1 Tax=Anaerohalosphaera lusitana TaxID=1936003 RepID=A0A1U9NH95_9BACT|nr:thioesterase family protein [Anaerohalosphaera lusitana]AQT67128.1 Acyl-CoA thioester hydrolase YbgC [Anaerohalosphaera lusitana]
MSTEHFPQNVTVDSNTTQIVPRYVETDQGGVVHHTVYPIYFEVGRTELLRDNGLAYSELEKAGVFFVVSDMTVKYRRPAFYDEKLLLITTCTKTTNARVEHHYELKRAETGVTLAEGTTTLACIDKQGKVCRMPEFMFPED